MPARANPIRFTAVCPVLICKNLPKSLDFFKDKLGFKVEFTWPDPPIYAGVCRGECSLHLAATGKPGRSNKAAWTRDNKPADVGFFVSDVDRLYKEFKRRGAKIASKPRAWSYGIRDIDVLTPDGQVLRFNQVIEHEKK